MSLLTLFIGVTVLLMLQGCVGGTTPAVRILRISNQAPAEYVVRHDAPVIVLENLDAFPALERSAVLGGKDNVLTPSSRLSWEGTPADIATANLARGLNATGRFSIVWPARSRVRHDAKLTGRVESFELQLDEPQSMNISISFSLWNAFGRELLATKTISASRPILRMIPPVMAQAASEAMHEIIENTENWLVDTGLPAVAATRGQ